MLAASAIRLGDIAFDGENIYWSESRPLEKGRMVIQKWENNQAVDCLSDRFSARSKVHEYGGGSFIAHDKTLFFSNQKDQHLYSLSSCGTAIELTKSDTKRYANPVYDPHRNCIYAVEEEHLSEHNVINRLVKIDPEGTSAPEILHEGHDFYSMPAIDPKGKKIAFLTWDVPHMPWDSSAIWMASLSDRGTLENLTQVIGGEGESVYEPRFAPDGTLYFSSDRSGYWNLYRSKESQAEPICPIEAEIGYPHWTFGLYRYAFLGDSYIGCIYTEKGVDQFGMIDLQTGMIERIPLPFTHYKSVISCGKTLIFIAASPTSLPGVYQYNPFDETLTTIRQTQKTPIEKEMISLPEQIEFIGSGGESSFAFYYPPTHSEYEGEEGDKPPLIVKSHGGPSGHSSAALSLEIQYWTSRGFAFLDVNYGGSTGHGRAYLRRLEKSWGIVDVEDCIAGARYLIDHELVHPDQLAIRGSSAGGYTTLCALTFHDFFKAGACYYGVSDLEALASDTHKFEAHYLEGLVGPYPKEQSLYQERSPIQHVDKLNCPTIFFQGSEDKVVPPSQSEKLYQALKKQSIPTEYLLFQGEGHGFFLAETIEKAIESELSFYLKVFAI